jgi:FkbM family methyltransferase
MKVFLRKIINGLGYDIVKYSTGSEKYRIKSDATGLSLYNTPTGKYYLPAGIKKDVVANTIKNGGYFEQEIIDVAKMYIKEGTTVLDVGANFGQMSIVFSKLAGSAGKVYSFEAEPTINEILKKNIAVNNCSNVEIISGAVYNENGKKIVFPEPDFKRFDSYGSYGVDPNAHSGRTVETLMIDSLDIKTPVSFMKVDIQGSDLFALQGAVKTIQYHQMPVLFEFEEQFQQEFKTSFNDYAEFVRSVNYRFASVTNGINFLILPNE